MIFGKKKKKPVFFHRGSGNRTKTSQSSLPAGCKVSECALVGLSTHGTCGEDGSGKENPASLAGQPPASLATLSQGILSPFKHPVLLLAEHLPHLDIWQLRRGLTWKESKREPAEEKWGMNWPRGQRGGQGTSVQVSSQSPCAYGFPAGLGAPWGQALGWHMTRAYQV